MKRLNLLKLMPLLLVLLFVTSCEKEVCNCQNGNQNIDNYQNNELIGTTWQYGHPTTGVGCYLEFTSNNKFTITGMYRGSTSSTKYGSYTLNNRSISLSNAQFSTPNGVSITFNSATFNSVVMTASGSQNGTNETFTLNKM